MLEPEDDWGRAVPTLAELTEQAGLDLVSLADHPYCNHRLDAMRLLTAVAARTSRVTLFPNLANLPRREPLMLARAAATLDIISGGRFELGLATGAQQLWDQIVADGGPQRSAGESVTALEEAIAIIRASWAATGPVPVQGSALPAARGHERASPAHDVGIWVGAYQRRMLQLAGRTADGWVPSSPAMPPEQLGRPTWSSTRPPWPPGAHRGTSCGSTTSRARSACPIPASCRGRPGSGCSGSPTSRLPRASAGSCCTGSAPPTCIKRFAAEVAPAVRQAVAAARAAAAR